MKKITLILVFTASFFFLAAHLSCKSSGKSSAAKLLKFNLEKGRGYDYDLVWDMSMGAMGNISVGALYSMNVTEEEEHIRTIKTIYRNFRMSIDMMGNKIEIDTDKPVPADDKEDEDEAIPAAMMNKVFGAIVGKSFTMKVNEEGNILEVNGFGDLVAGMFDSLDIDEDQRDMLMASVKDQFNEQQIKDQLGEMLMIFPNKEVKVGDSWDKNFSKGGKMPSKYTTTYTVKEIEGDHVTLNTKTRIEPADEGMNLKGEQTGTVIIDSKTGLMINGEFNQDIDVESQGKNIKITGKGKIKGKAN